MSEILYGRQPVLEMLRAGKRKVIGVMMRNSVKPTKETDEIVRLAEEAGVRVEAVDQQRLIKMTNDGNHQGLAARVSNKNVFKYNDLSAKLIE